MKISWILIIQIQRGYSYETIAIICLLSKELIQNYDKASDTRLTEKSGIQLY